MEAHVHCTCIYMYAWYVDQTGEKDKVVGWEVRGRLGRGSGIYMF